MDYINFSNGNNMVNINGQSYNIQYDIESPKPKEVSEEIKKAKEEKKEREKKIMETIKSESISTSNLFRNKNRFNFLRFSDFDEETYKDEYNNFSTPVSYMKFNEDNEVEFDLQSTDPIECGRKLYNRKTVIIKPNAINTLIGCNGAGKSTILLMMKDILSDNKYPMLKFDNLKDGGIQEPDIFGNNGDYSLLATQISSSEGENIVINTFPYIDLLNDIIAGKYIRDDHFHLYRDTDHIFLLLDAVDSGFSIDNIVNIKNRLNISIELAKKNNKYLYIIAAANSFELVRDTRSWDVQASKEIFFNKDYEAYRKRIIETRNRILKQWDKAK